MICNKHMFDLPDTIHDWSTYKHTMAISHYFLTCCRAIGLDFPMRHAPEFLNFWGCC